MWGESGPLRRPRARDHSRGPATRTSTAEAALQPPPRAPTCALPTRAAPAAPLFSSNDPSVELPWPDGTGRRGSAPMEDSITASDDGLLRARVHRGPWSTLGQRTDGRYHCNGTERMALV